MNYKNNKWQEEIDLLSSVISECGLEKTEKWNQPCFTYRGKNIILLGAFKNYCVLSFIKGVLLTDTDNLLTKPGVNTHAVRVMRFQSLEEIKKLSNTIKSYIYEAIDIERKNIPLPKPNKNNIEFPDELIQFFSQDSELEKAFTSLPPGKQRGYLLYFTTAKQSKTIENRIHKYVQRIMMGKGINDCICGLSRKMPACDGSHQSIAKS